MSVYEANTTRAEHLAWCKHRAYQYLDRGDYLEAWASFVSYMRKHDGTKEHCGIDLGMFSLLSGHTANVPEMRKFIEGFN